MAATPAIIFDLSRLISRAGRETPTGIDRVELAYAERLIAGPEPFRPIAITAAGRFGRLPLRPAAAYVAALAAIWRGERAAPRPAATVRLARRLQLAAPIGGEGAVAARLRTAPEPPVYLLVSHHHLEKRTAIARLKKRTGARFVCLIHDLIPMQYPEYALPGQADRHRRRMESAAALADAVIVNSHVTGEAFRPLLQLAGRAPPLIIAPLGLDWPPTGAGPEPPSIEPPYFVCIGTIEARKNHLLLLNLWRRFAAEHGSPMPRLVLIGQRGWETENVVDMLERCPGLRGVVFEHARLSDHQTARLIAGASALLLPSFAEGFGFPVAEALAQGTPVLCSDIPALRETGGAVPEYLDPLDGMRWHDTILDYAAPDSPRRAAQLARMAGWRQPRWEDHFAAVDALIADTAVQSPTANQPPPR